MTSHSLLDVVIQGLYGWAVSRFTVVLLFRENPSGGISERTRYCPALPGKSWTSNSVWRHSNLGLLRWHLRHLRCHLRRVRSRIRFLTKMNVFGTSELNKYSTLSKEFTVIVKRTVCSKNAFLFSLYKLYQFYFIGHFVEIHTSTLIFMPYLVNISKTKTDIEKMREAFLV